MWRQTFGTGAATTLYVFDPQGRLLAEHDDATGNPLKEYIWIDDLPVAVVDYTSGAAATYYIHTGQMDEPLVLTNASKAKVWDAYVNPWGKAQTFTAASAFIDLRLPGQWLQLEANGLHQNGMRDYDPSLGRYVQADPLGLAAGQNVYAYVDDDPLNNSDPWGLDGASAWQLGFEWLTGRGPRVHNFGQGDPLTNDLLNHKHIQDLLREICMRQRPLSGADNYSLGGIQGVPEFLSDYSAISTGGLTGNLAAAYLGSYSLRYSTSGSVVNIYVSNTSDLRSATHPPIIGYTQWWNNSVGAVLNSLTRSGPLSPTHQNFDFHAQLNCGCKL